MGLGKQPSDSRNTEVKIPIKSMLSGRTWRSYSIVNITLYKYTNNRTLWLSWFPVGSHKGIKCLGVLTGRWVGRKEALHFMLGPVWLGQSHPLVAPTERLSRYDLKCCLNDKE